MIFYDIMLTLVIRRLEICIINNKFEGKQNGWHVILCANICVCLNIYIYKYIYIYYMYLLFQ